MKKVLLFILAAGSITFASAQSRDYSSKPTLAGSHGGQVSSSSTFNKPGNYGTTAFDRELKKINQEFDAKIFAIKKDRHMNSNQKSKKISKLEKQRQSEISQLEHSFRNTTYNSHQKSNSRNW